MATSVLQLLAFLTFLSLQLENPKRSPKNLNSITNKNLAINKTQDHDADTMQIICDSVYKHKGYKITLIRFDSDNEDETKFNSVFILSKLINGKYKQIFRDSIYNRVQEVRFNDFNNDNVKDILIQNYSDVRSNWTYSLYLADTKRDKLKKIRGFEKIKNPNYLPKYNLIDNYVLSGKNWTSFYKIKGDNIKDFNIVIYDDQTDNGNYDRDYKKAIKRILAKEKNNR